MERISELMLQLNGNELRTMQSKPQLPDASVFALGALMQQARDFYPNQTLPEGTPDVYLKAWEEIAQVQGMKRFEAGLWKALRNHDFFPTPGQIEDECEVIRKASVNPRSELDKINAQVAHAKAHPEEYVTTEEWAEVTAPLAKRFGLEKPKEIDLTPEMATCPHCSKELPVARNVRFWTPQEMRDYADVLEEVRAIADRNRAMAKLPLEDVVEGVA